MYITIMFKNKSKEFVGRSYDYELLAGEEVPEVGSIIRMMDSNCKPVCYGTRVKVVGIKNKSDLAKVAIKYTKASLDEDE